MQQKKRGAGNGSPFFVEVGSVSSSQSRSSPIPTLTLPLKRREPMVSSLFKGEVGRGMGEEELTANLSAIQVGCCKD